MRKFLLLLLLPTLLAAFPNQEKAKDQMISDLEFFRATFQAQYAPMEWKATFGDWDLDQEINKAQQQVRNEPSMTVKDYQRILKNFFGSMGDYHVNISFISTESSYLPIHFKEANGKFFITGVEAHLIKDRTAKSIAVGDEILTIDGKPVAEVINAYLDDEYNGGFTRTDRSTGVMYFPLRMGALGQKSPQGTLLFGVRQKLTGQVKAVKIDWIYTKEQVANIIPPAGAKGARKQATKVAKQEPAFAFLKGSMMAPQFAVLQKSSYTLGSDMIGSRESFLPDLGVKSWESNPDSCPFYAYTFTLSTGERIGYVRIAHYEGSTFETNQFREIIRKFNTTTDALIIDQLNNPGGSVFYMYALASMLTDKPLQVPLHRIALTQKEVIGSIEDLDAFQNLKSDSQAQSILGSDLDGYPVTLSLAKGCSEYMSFQIEEWNKGHVLTDPVALFGLKTIKPDVSAKYTKPLLILINELDFSCGDFFPAILQDNRRGVLMGARTGGAGGYILSAEHPNLFGIDSFTYTGSLAERVDHNPIENLGVHPDIYYDLTENDLQNRYADYTASILEQIKKMLP